MKLPSDAFERYVALGPSRSYSAFAESLGCSKRSVTARAAKEGWQGRLREIESGAYRAAFDEAVRDLASVNMRHLDATRELQTRCLAALKALPIDTVTAAIRGLDLSIRLERLILEAPEKRTHLTVEKNAQLYHHHDNVPGLNGHEIERP